MIHEKERLSIDVANLVDESNFNQNAAFSAAVIKSEDQSLKMLKVLQEMGVNCAKIDNLNQTPLYYAAREGNNKVIEYLIANGCDVNHVDTYG